MFSFFALLWTGILKVLSFIGTFLFSLGFGLYAMKEFGLLKK